MQQNPIPFQQTLNSPEYGLVRTLASIQTSLRELQLQEEKSLERSYKQLADLDEKRNELVSQHKRNNSQLRDAIALVLTSLGSARPGQTPWQQAMLQSSTTLQLAVTALRRAYPSHPLLSTAEWMGIGVACLANLSQRTSPQLNTFLDQLAMRSWQMFKVLEQRNDMNFENSALAITKAEQQRLAKNIEHALNHLSQIPKRFAILCQGIRQALAETTRQMKILQKV